MHALHCWAISQNLLLAFYYHTQCGCVPGSFTQRCAIWCYAVLIHESVYETASRWAVRDLRLHHLTVCQAISRKAVLFYVTLYNLTKYYAISSKADPFDLCAILCKILGYSILPESIAIMLCHFMYHYTIWHHANPGINTLCRLNSDR